MSKKITSIDLWNDHKPTQSIDPFIIDYFDESSLTFSYDKVILCPNLKGCYQVINPRFSELDSSICPEFNGGLIFFKNNVPIRLYLCQVNDIVEREIGHKYGIEDILKVINSKNKIGNTNFTLKELLKRNNIEIKIDETISSKFTAPNGTIAKNDPVLESADCMAILTSPTFLDDTKNWEAMSFNPHLIFNVGVIASDFEIFIEHKGYIVGIKRNISGLREGQKGKKLYGIALQTAKKEEYKKMVAFVKEFEQKVGNNPELETREIDLNKSLLDI